MTDILLGFHFVLQPLPSLHTSDHLELTFYPDSLQISWKKFTTFLADHFYILPRLDDIWDKFSYGCYASLNMYLQWNGQGQ